MIRPVAALMTSAAVSILGPVGGAAAMQPAQGPPPAAHAAHSAAPAADESDDMPVMIDQVSPSAVPRQGAIRLSGRVTNNTDQLARDVNIHPLVSQSPMTTTEEITTATEADPRQYWGERITDIGSFAAINRLEPGETKRWRLKIPQANLDINGTQGVYQIGVHVRAPGQDTADRVTYGRARTLIPLVDQGAKKVRTSLVLPLRGRVARDAEGRLQNSQGWQTALSAGGRLRNLVDFAEEAGGQPLTWLIDPSMVEAAEQMAAGNPPRDLNPTDGEEPEVDAGEPELLEAAPDAEAWLTELADVTKGRPVLALPYGDVDVAAAHRYADPLYERARVLSTRAFAGLGIKANPAIAPPSGYLPTEALDLVQAGTRVLLSSDSVPEREDLSEAEAPSHLDVGDHSVTIHDASAAETTEGTEDSPRTSVAVRQRILSEAAIRSLAGSEETLVVNLPADFDPGPRSRGFFSGMDRSFVKLAPLGTSSTGSTSVVDKLSYPSREKRAELQINAFIAADGLARAGVALDGILTRTDQVDRQVTGEALTTLSYAAREEKDTAMARATAATAWVRAQLGLITIEAPSFVILSAESGPFAVTVTNGMDQPITVAIKADAPDDVEIKAPETVELEANASQTVPLSAHTSNIGVHSIELQATDVNGNPLGSSDRLSVRSNAVGKVIWVIMAVGVGILFVAIPLRWIRRIRKGRSSD